MAEAIFDPVLVAFAAALPLLIAFAPLLTYFAPLVTAATVSQYPGIAATNDNPILV